MAGKVNHPEDDLQAAVMQWLAHIPGCWAWHCPNGGRRNIREAARLKKQGVVAGCPDVCIAHNGKLRCIELKCGKNKLTQAQEDFIDHLDACGIETKVCYSLAEVQDACKCWGIIP